MEVLEAKERKARKDHICDWCDGVIRKGELYVVLYYQRRIFWF